MMKNCIALRFAESTHWQMINTGAFAKFASDNLSEPPHKTNWKRFGFAHLDCFGAEPVFVGTNKTAAFCIRLQERLLPGKVIKAELRTKCIEFNERENRHPNRKEVAELKDSLIAELLPKALIRPTDIMCIVAWPYLFIDTGSFKVQEDIISWLRERLDSYHKLAEENLAYWPAEWSHMPLSLPPSVPAANWLRKVATTPFNFDIPENGDVPDNYAYFRRTSSVVLKSKETGVVRLKDVDFDDDDIERNLQSGRSVVELGIEWGNDAGETDITCRVTDHLAVKGIKFTVAMLDNSGSNEELPEDESHEVTRFDASLAITADTLRKFFDALIKQLHGEVLGDDKDLLDSFSRFEQTIANIIALQDITQFQISIGGSAKDELLEQAKQLCYENETLGASKLMRKLRIGYNRSHRLIETLADKNLLSGEDHNGVRKSLVYVSDDI